MRAIQGIATMVGIFRDPGAGVNLCGKRQPVLTARVMLGCGDDPHGPVPCPTCGGCDRVPHACAWRIRLPSARTSSAFI